MLYQCKFRKITKELYIFFYNIYCALHMLYSKTAKYQELYWQLIRKKVYKGLYVSTDQLVNRV